MNTFYIATYNTNKLWAFKKKKKIRNRLTNLKDKEFKRPH